MSGRPDAARSIDGHAVGFVEELRAACRIPSVSATGGEALFAMARLVEARLSTVLDTVALIPTGHDGPPAVCGELRGRDPRGARILLYSHYDVQPPEPLEDWTSGPFEAAVVDGSVVARGVADDKADVFARIHALEAFVTAYGRPPFTVIWLCEGAEEIGSIGLRELVLRNQERLRADCCDTFSRWAIIEAVTIGWSTNIPITSASRELDRRPARPMETTCRARLIRSYSSSAKASPTAMARNCQITRCNPVCSSGRLAIGVSLRRPTST